MSRERIEAMILEEAAILKVKVHDIVVTTESLMWGAAPFFRVRVLRCGVKRQAELLKAISWRCRHMGRNSYMVTKYKEVAVCVR